MIHSQEHYFQIFQVDISTLRPLTEEALRLLEEQETPGPAYTDAGLEEQITALRNDPSVRYSVEVFIFAVETLNKEP